MGLIDTVRARVEQAMAKAHQGISQLEPPQPNRRGEALLRDLGAAYYAQERTGGAGEAVTEALAKIDNHVADHGPVDAPPAMPPPAGMPTAVGRRA